MVVGYQESVSRRTSRLLKNVSRFLRKSIISRLLREGLQVTEKGFVGY